MFCKHQKFTKVIVDLVEYVQPFKMALPVVAESMNHQKIFCSLLGMVVQQRGISNLETTVSEVQKFKKKMSL